MGIQRGGNLPGGIWPGGNLPRGNLIGGNLPGGFDHLGIFLVTFKHISYLLTYIIPPYNKTWL